MKTPAKAAGVFINLANYAAGIAVVITLLFKLDFISVFYLESMSSAESLFFNLLLFQAGLALLGVVICLLMNENAEGTQKEILFPTAYLLPALVITGISIFYAFGGETVREKTAVCLLAVGYSLFSAIIIYCGTRIFQISEK